MLPLVRRAEGGGKELVNTIGSKISLKQTSLWKDNFHFIQASVFFPSVCRSVCVCVRTTTVGKTERRECCCLSLVSSLLVSSRLVRTCMNTETPNSLLSSSSSLSPSIRPAAVPSIPFAGESSQVLQREMKGKTVSLSSQLRAKVHRKTGRKPLFLWIPVSCECGWQDAS